MDWSSRIARATRKPPRVPAAPPARGKGRVTNDNYDDHGQRIGDRPDPWVMQVHGLDPQHFTTQEQAVSVASRIIRSRTYAAREMGLR